MAKVRTVDPSVYEFADMWLTAERTPTPPDVMSLSRAIQEAIEDWQEAQAQEAADRSEQLAEGAGYTAEERSRI